MYDHIEVVQQNPAGLALSFTAIRFGPTVAQCLLYLLDDSGNLPFVVPRADDEVVRDADDGAYFKDDDVFALLICSRPGCDQRPLQRFVQYLVPFREFLGLFQIILTHNNGHIHERLPLLRDDHLAHSKDFLNFLGQP